MIKKWISLVAILFLAVRLIAQTDLHSITGSIRDKYSKAGVEFTSVQLLRLNDSAVVTTTVTDRKGNFLLEKIADGNYILVCSYIGYETTMMPIAINQKNENLGIIGIGVIAKNMSEVTVISRQSLLKTSIDRKVYNVAQDIMAQSGSVSDILKNIPSVEVDIEGQVSLRGSPGVMILINGKPSPLMGRSSAEVLQQLPANTIERIEVITNPSARYKPDGTSGIINIVLKKNIKSGWNGSVTGNAGSRDRYNGSLSLNYKPGKLNLSSTYSIRQDNRIRTNIINREYLDATGKTDSFYAENNGSSAKPVSNIIMLGADYTINERNSIGISGNYFYRKMTRKDFIQKSFSDKNRVLTGKSDRLRFDPEIEKEHDVTVYWQHMFPREDHQLRLEINTSADAEKEDNRFTTNYQLPAGQSTFDNTLINQTDHQQQVNLDYSNPLSENSKLESGYDGSFNQIDLDFYGEYYNTLQAAFVKDMTRSNRFKYSEGIHAVYTTYGHSFDKFGYSAGLRAEQVFINGNLVNKDSAISNKYFKIYPTLHLSYQLKKGEVQFNYSKRVNRPDGDELNPFPEYRDPYNLQAGNPKLLPEIVHSLEMGYKWENDYFTFVPSLYYRYTRNGFTSITLPLNDSVLLTTQQNLSNERSTGLELIFSAKAGKFLTANLSSNIFYNRIDASGLGYGNKKSIVSASVNFNSTATLTKTTMLQVSCSYRSARQTPQGKVFGSFVLNTGLRQDLFKKKVSLTFTASDIFKTLKQRSELYIPGLNQVSVGRRDARIIFLGISYKFGRAIKKSNDDENLQFDNAL